MGRNTSPLNATFTLTTPETPFAAAAVSPAGANRDACAIEVRDDEPRQTMRGFGGCFNELGWTALQTLPERLRREVVEALFSPAGCAFSICRVPIGASDYAVSWYSHAEVFEDFALEHFSIARDEWFLIHYIRAAMEVRPDLRLWASAWSPPCWMKTTGTYHGGSLRWEKPVLDAYANYLSKFVHEYRRRGLNLESVHVQNEPVADQPFPSCLWTAGQIAEFVGRHLGPRFECDGTAAEIWLGALNCGDLAYSECVLRDPVAAGYLDGAGYQWDGRRAIASIHELFPDLPLMQTENECGDGANDWAAAAHTWELLKTYIEGGAGAYTYWNMVLDETGTSTWGWKQNSMISVRRQEHDVRYHPEFYLLKHLSHFVTPGAQFLTLGSKGGNALAFRNPDGAMVVLLANFTEKTERVRICAAGQAIEVALPGPSIATAVFPAQERVEAAG